MRYRGSTKHCKMRLWVLSSLNTRGRRPYWQLLRIREVIPDKNSLRSANLHPMSLGESGLGFSGRSTLIDRPNPPDGCHGPPLLLREFPATTEGPSIESRAPGLTRYLLMDVLYAPNSACFPSEAVVQGGIPAHRRGTIKQAHQSRQYGPPLVRVASVRQNYQAGSGGISPVAPPTWCGTPGLPAGGPGSR